MASTIRKFRTCKFTRRIKMDKLMCMIAVKERANYKCERCGSIDRCDFHHIKSPKDYPLLKYEPSNIQYLCYKCHHIDIHGSYKSIDKIS